jgi:hypothetical protein
MKRILDSSFRYRASFATDVRKTFERVRKQQQQERTKTDSEVRVKVLQLDQLKKVSSGS